MPELMGKGKAVTITLMPWKVPDQGRSAQSPPVGDAEVPDGNLLVSFDVWQDHRGNGDPGPLERSRQMRDGLVGS
ncbi:hypothetical protein O7600_16490 [Micromonospora sp. WMMA1998]|uniref:hypothetical protein n=1 Tax=Micromonospora sp. WMMA1998 TaxID=3015167 RepID=UPI00248CDEB9|nr:hypothetical protein [Micromonospora sp. WMMA1998]WBC12782.1 hypothetical protein O7600_16490 [Micromonospora sp. WMMA1998]